MRKVAALLLVFAAVLARPAGAGEPVAVVEEFHAGLIAVMKEGKALGPNGRFDRIAPLLDRLYHMPVMARIASGKYWHTAAAPDKTELIEAFRRKSAATYAAHFTGYGGERFETIGEKTGPQKTRLVLTRLVLADSDPVELTYITKQKADNGWLVVDVLLDNDISELAVRRSEYNLVLEKEGVAGLVALLNGKADELLAR